MKKNKYIMTLVMALILLISSIGMYMAYPYIHQNVTESDIENNITSYLASRIFYSSYAIHQELNEKDNIDTPIESYIQVADNQQSLRIKENFIDRVEHAKSELLNQNDFAFAAKNNKTGQTLSNTNDLFDIYTQKSIQEKYQWYITIQYNSQGNVSYQSNLQNQENLENYVSSMISSYDDDYNEYDYNTETNINVKSDLTNPQDLTITFAVNKDIAPTSGLYAYISETSVSDYLRFEFPYVLGLCLLIIILIFVTPYQYLKTIQFLELTSKIKFAFLLFFWCLFTGSLFYFSPFLISAVYSGDFTQLYKTFGISALSGVLTPLINILFWFVFFTLIIIFPYMIKYLFNKGLKAYCKENTCLGWVIVNSHKIMNKVINFDLDDDINRAVLKIVFLNFIIMTIISVFFVFGFFFAFIYSIVIFYLLRNKFREIKNDYEVLLNATRRLSNGQFDIDINEDVGIFNPLKNEFTHIKDGFEKAVKEEVKSQKMKTELISNVSHDLKTPLTSIITYVDLLKKDELTDEERNQYIQVLERNSLRLKNLINDLFEVSKANSGDIKLSFMDVDIVSLIKQAELECLDKLEEKSLDIKMNISQEKIIYSLDSSKTYRIFENLFMNISKYALAHTRVYIDIIEDDDKVTIIFKNISEHEMNFNENEIVERFVQGDKSRNTNGSGLGLAIVKSFTELQKGKFNVEIDGDLFKSIIIFYK